MVQRSTLARVRKPSISGLFVRLAGPRFSFQRDNLYSAKMRRWRRLAALSVVARGLAVPNTRYFVHVEPCGTSTLNNAHRHLSTQPYSVRSFHSGTSKCKKLSILMPCFTSFRASCHLVLPHPLRASWRVWLHKC